MAEFSRALDMLPQSLNNYLSGQMKPGNKLQAKLRLLGCDIEWLMTGVSVQVRYKDGRVSEPLAPYNALKDLPEKKRKQIEKMIDQLKELDEDDVEKAREIVKAAFGKRPGGSKR